MIHLVPPEDGTSSFCWQFLLPGIKQTLSFPLYLPSWSPGLHPSARLFSFWSTFLWMYLFAFLSKRASKWHCQFNFGFTVNFIWSSNMCTLLSPVPTSTHSLMFLLTHQITKQQPRHGGVQTWKWSLSWLQGDPSLVGELRHARTSL